MSKTDFDSSAVPANPASMIRPSVWGHPGPPPYLESPSSTDHTGAVNISRTSLHRSGQTKSRQRHTERISPASCRLATLPDYAFADIGFWRGRAGQSWSEGARAEQRNTYPWFDDSPQKGLRPGWRSDAHEKWTERATLIGSGNGETVECRGHRTAQISECCVSQNGMVSFLADIGPTANQRSGRRGRKTTFETKAPPHAVPTPSLRFNGRKHLQPVVGNRPQPSRHDRAILYRRVAHAAGRRQRTGYSRSFRLQLDRLWLTQGYPSRFNAPSDNDL